MLFILAAMAAILFVVCKKDDNALGLAGTIWICTEGWNDGCITVAETNTINFKGDGTLVLRTNYQSSYETDEWVENGTYSYDPPEIRLHIDGEYMTGTVIENSMTLYWDDGEMRGTFYKK